MSFPWLWYFPPHTSLLSMYALVSKPLHPFLPFPPPAGSTVCRTLTPSSLTGTCVWCRLSERQRRDVPFYCLWSVVTLYLWHRWWRCLTTLAREGVWSSASLTYPTQLNRQTLWTWKGWRYGGNSNDHPCQVNRNIIMSWWLLCCNGFYWMSVGCLSKLSALCVTWVLGELCARARAFSAFQCYLTLKTWNGTGDEATYTASTMQYT